MVTLMIFRFSCLASLFNSIVRYCTSFQWFNVIFYVFTTGTCTFDNNFCDWTNVFDDDGEWHLAHGDTPSEGTGPHYDSDGKGKKKNLLIHHLHIKKEIAF